MSHSDFSNLLRGKGWEQIAGQWVRIGVNHPGIEVLPESLQPPPKPPKRIRQDTKPLMNKLESEFQRDYEANTHHNLLPQSIRFKLGNGIWYKPDFMLFIPAGVFAFEVKGPYSFRGGFENLKVAASKYLSITWRLVWKENGEWKEQTVLP